MESRANVYTTLVAGPANATVLPRAILDAYDLPLEPPRHSRPAHWGKKTFVLFFIHVVFSSLVIYYILYWYVRTQIFICKKKVSKSYNLNLNMYSYEITIKKQKWILRKCKYIYT